MTNDESLAPAEETDSGEGAVALTSQETAESDAEPGAPESEESPKSSNETGGGSGVDDRDHDASPDPLERTIPKEFARMLSGESSYSFEELRSQGAAAFGPNASALSVQINSSSSPEPFWVQQRDSEQVKDALRRHTEAESDEHLSHHVTEVGLACLAGVKGTGRMSSAIVALARRFGVDGVHEIVPSQPGELNLETVIRQPQIIEKGCGYLLNLSEASLDWSEVETLSKILQHQGSGMVVLVSGGEHLGLGRFVVRQITPLASRIFWRQLESQTEGRPCAVDCQPCQERSGTCRDRLLRLCRDSALLMKELSSGGAPALAVDLATRIASRWPRTTADLGEALSDRWLHKLARARELLAVESSLNPIERRRNEHQRAYRIAYAVFVNCPLTLVSDAANMLVAAQKTSEDSDDNQHGFGEAVSNLVPESMRGTNRDLASEELASFNEEDMFWALLEVAWKDYSNGREVLLEWLDMLVRDSRARMRQRAAATAAYFAGFAPELVFSRLIDKWSKSWFGRSRQAAGLALVVAMRDHRSIRYASQRISRWSLCNNGLRLDTLARAYVSGLGEYQPTQRAMRHIERVARNDDRCWLSVGPAMAQLFAMEPTGVVMKQLEWVSGKNPQLALHAAVTMPLVADLHVTDGNGTTPALLQWMSDDEGRRADLVKLWRHSLIVPRTATRAWRILGAWVMVALFDEVLSNRVLALMSEICRDSVFQVRLKFYMNRMWTLPRQDSALVRRLAALTEGTNNDYVAV